MALGFIFWIVVVCWILVKCKSAWVRGLFTQFGQTNFVALPLSSFRRPFLYIGNLYSLRSLSAGGASLPYKARRNKPGYGFLSTRSSENSVRHRTPTFQDHGVGSLAATGAFRASSNT